MTVYDVVVVGGGAAGLGAARAAARARARVLLVSDGATARSTGACRPRR